MLFLACRCVGVDHRRSARVIARRIMSERITLLTLRQTFSHGSQTWGHCTSDISGYPTVLRLAGRVREPSRLGPLVHPIKGMRRSVDRVCHIRLNLHRR